MGDGVHNNRTLVNVGHWHSRGKGGKHRGCEEDVLHDGHGCSRNVCSSDADELVVVLLGFQSRLMNRRSATVAVTSLLTRAEQCKEERDVKSWIRRGCELEWEQNKEWLFMGYKRERERRKSGNGRIQRLVESEEEQEQRARKEHGR